MVLRERSTAWHHLSPLVVLLAASFPIASCSVGASDGTDAPRRGACPVDPVPVVVSVDQWADVVGSIGGDCVDVTTVVASGAADPHDFEPRPSDLLSIDRAGLVVTNGLGYDTWASKAVDAMPRRPLVVEAGSVARREEPDDASAVDPHVWYDPTAVERVSAAIADRLGELVPRAAGYVDRRAARWQQALRYYRSELDRVSGSVRGRTYVATEPLFDATARSLGLQDLTPPGYRSAVANGSEPTPGQLAELQAVMRSGAVDVVITDAGTDGPVSESIRDAAGSAGVPIVVVSESRPSGRSFLGWQSDQVRAVAAALGS